MSGAARITLKMSGRSVVKSGTIFARELTSYLVNLNPSPAQQMQVKRKMKEAARGMGITVETLKTCIGIFLILAGGYLIFLNLLYFLIPLTLAVLFLIGVGTSVEVCRIVALAFLLSVSDNGFKSFFLRRMTPNSEKATMSRSASGFCDPSSNSASSESDRSIPVHVNKEERNNTIRDGGNTGL